MRSCSETPCELGHTPLTFLVGPARRGLFHVIIRCIALTKAGEQKGRIDHHRSAALRPVLRMG
jgi:hypothetical protein